MKDVLSEGKFRNALRDAVDRNLMARAGQALGPTIVLTSAMLAVGSKRGTFVISGMLLAPALIARWLHHTHPHLNTGPYYMAFGMAFIGFVVVNLLRFVLRASRMDAEVLCAGVSAYLMIGLLWSLGYALVGLADPKAFSFSNPVDARLGMSGFNAFYFSFVTLTTVGFGDIAPVSKLARTMATMESVAGTLCDGAYCPAGCHVFAGQLCGRGE